MILCTGPLLAGGRRSGRDLDLVAQFYAGRLDYIQSQCFRPDRLGPQRPNSDRRPELWPDLARFRPLNRPNCKSPNPIGEKLFPGLKLISAGSSEFSHGVSAIKDPVPDVRLQEKGLLATEAPLSFPSERHQAFLPLLNEVFFEFRNDQGQLLRLDQVAIGESYELLISRKSGLLRYRLKDRVRIRKRSLIPPVFSSSAGVKPLRSRRRKAQRDLCGRTGQTAVPRHFCLVPIWPHRGTPFFRTNDWTFRVL